ncbi:MAG: hypothetical protein SNJ64_04100 [Endomicrobiia bacterium]
MIYYNFGNVFAKVWTEEVDGRTYQKISFGKKLWSEKNNKQYIVSEFNPKDLADLALLLPLLSFLFVQKNEVVEDKPKEKPQQKQKANFVQDEFSDTW